MGKKIEKFMESLEPCLKETFIECMDDKEVREKLFNIFCEFMSVYEKDTKGNSQEIDDLKSQIEEKNRTISELARRAERAESESERANQAIIRLRQEKEELHEELSAEKAKPKFDEKLVSAYGAYCELPQEIREKYSNMLGNGKAEEFLLKGTKYALKLYERICMDWSRLDSETLKNMSKIFDYIFEQFYVINLGYRRLCVEVGEPFDMRIHTRTADSRPSGFVQEVILCGYTDGNNKTEKSLVRIG